MNGPVTSFDRRTEGFASVFATVKGSNLGSTLANQSYTYIDIYIYIYILFVCLFLQMNNKNKYFPTQFDLG